MNPEQATATYHQIRAAHRAAHIRLAAIAQDADRNADRLTRTGATVERQHHARYLARTLRDAARILHPTDPTDTP